MWFFLYNSEILIYKKRIVINLLAILNYYFKANIIIHVKAYIKMQAKNQLFSIKEGKDHG